MDADWPRLEEGLLDDDVEAKEDAIMMEENDVLIPLTAPTTMLSEELNSPWISQCDISSMACAFEAHGLVVDAKAIKSGSVLAAVRAEALATLATSLSLPEEAQRALFPAIRAPAHRHDVKLELSPHILGLLSELLREKGSIGSTIAACLGDEAVLCELSCLVSEKGSIAQNAHADTPNDSLATDALALALTDAAIGAPMERPRRLLTAFVALQDIGADMGPTLIWPNTHTTTFHDAVLLDGPDVFLSTVGVHMDLAAGGAALMDSRTWHCGGANSSDAPRCVLVASFGAEGSYPLGSTYSMLEHLVGKLTLRRLRDAPVGASPSALLDEASDDTPRRQPPDGGVASRGASKAINDDLLAWMADLPSTRPRMT